MAKEAGEICRNGWDSGPSAPARSSRDEELASNVPEIVQRGMGYKRRKGAAGVVERPSDRCPGRSLGRTAKNASGLCRATLAQQGKDQHPNAEECGARKKNEDLGTSEF